jgi:ATP-dependent Lhr-like helicase
MTAHVRPAKQKSGIVPRWAGGKSPLSTLLSQAIRRKFDEARQGESAHSQ